MIEHGLLEIEDYCCIQRAKINLAKAGLTLILGDNQDTNAAINNGTGKTTIPKALTWCLYEDTIDGDRYDEIIRWGQNRARVSHTFRLKKDVWRITRSRTKGRPRLELSVARNFRKGAKFDPIPGERKELQARINELLGKDFRSFCNTTLYGEGDVERFYSATDSVKKDSVHRLLKSDIFKRAMTYIKKNYYDGLKKTVEKLEQELEVLEGRLGEYDISQIRADYERWERDRDSRIERCSDDCSEYLKEIETAKNESATGQRQQRGELRGIARKLGEIEKLIECHKGSPEELDNMKFELVKYDGRQGRLDEKINAKQESLLLLQGDECPTCTSPLSEGKGLEHKEELVSTLSGLDHERCGVVTKINELKVAIEKKERKVQAFESALQERVELRARKEVLDGVLETSTSRLEGYIAERKKLADHAIKNAARIEKEKNPHEDSLQKAGEKVDQLKIKIAEKKTELDNARSDFAHYGFWIKGFGPGGLPSLLLDSKMDFLSERANHYLLTLADGDISVFYRTQRELKQKGQMRDEIVAEVMIEGIPNVKPSKAQKRKLDIASDLGLMDMAISSSGHSNLLMMDEVLDGMDSEGVRRVLDLIHELRFAYSSIFVITHEAGLLEIFDRAICARKKGGATNVVVMKG